MLWFSTQWFAELLSVHLTLHVSLREFACVKSVPMMEKWCVAQTERVTTTFVSSRRSHAKVTPFYGWSGKVHVRVGFRYCISSVCIVVPSEGEERQRKREMRSLRNRGIRSHQKGLMVFQCLSCKGTCYFTSCPKQVKCCVIIQKTHVMESNK